MTPLTILMTMTTLTSPEQMGECDRRTHPKEGLVLHSPIGQTGPNRGAAPTPWFDPLWQRSRA